MTYEQLRVVQAIVQTGTFRGASGRVYKSQPAVSALVKNLEQELGFEIFRRDTYRPALTDNGRVFYERSVVALKEMLGLKALAERLTGEEEPQVRLAVNNVCPLATVLRTLRNIDARYPTTRLIVSTESMGGAMERLARAETDIALTTESDVDAGAMQARPYRSVRIIPVARPDYGPAARGGLNSVEDVRGDVQVIVADSSHGERKQTLDVIAEARHWVVTDMAAKKEIVMAGMGWGGLPEHWVAEELAAGELVRVHVEGFAVRNAQLYVVRRTDRPPGVVAQALWQALATVNE